MKIDKHSNTLWATSNQANQASVRQYDLQTGQVRRTARIDGKHAFNDLALASSGAVFVTDTTGDAVYELDGQNSALRKIASGHTFTAGNGIAISPGEKMLYISAWGDGLDVIDLESGSATPIQQQFVSRTSTAFTRPKIA